VEFNIHLKVYAMSKNQRDLGNNSAAEVLGSITQMGNSTDVDRDLQSYPGYCKNNCNGYVSGRCMALNCKGYRKSIEAAESKSTSLRPKRDLLYATICDNQKSEMNNLLTNFQLTCYGTELF
jgi:hypothetical protein